MTSQTISAAILIIGNEILSGRTQDQNVAFIAIKLAKIGIILKEVRVIPDEKSRIIQNTLSLSTTYDYVFTTGGIGPTHDDITSESMSEAFGLEYTLNEEARKMLETSAAKMQKELNKASLKMAYIPKGATLLDNPISGAPGFVIDNVYVLPGVPHIMQAMFEILVNDLKHGASIETKSIDVYVGESLIAKNLEEVQNKYDDVQIGSYPFTKNGAHATSVVLTSSNPLALESAYNELRELLPTQ